MSRFTFSSINLNVSMGEKHADGYRLWGSFSSPLLSDQLIDPSWNIERANFTWMIKIQAILTISYIINVDNRETCLIPKSKNFEWVILWF